MSTKAELRLKSRSGVPSAQHRQALSVQIQKLLKNESAFLKAPKVALYAPRAFEVNALGLWEPSGRFYFPKVVGMELAFGQVDSLDQLVSGYSGILEPPSTQPVIWGPDDMILVPGRLFDRMGGRLGSGKGYYDRFLSQCPAAKWGLCWELQLQSEPIPMEEHDMRMDVICTPVQVLRIELDK